MGSKTLFRLTLLGHVQPQTDKKKQKKKHSQNLIGQPFSVLHAKRNKFLMTNIHRVLKHHRQTKECRTVPLGSLNLLLTKVIRDVFTVWQNHGYNSYVMKQQRHRPQRLQWPPDERSSLIHLPTYSEKTSTSTFSPTKVQILLFRFRDRQHNYIFMNLLRYIFYTL